MPEQCDQLLFKCNYDEADTRVVLHAYLKDTSCVVVSKDTDVFVLMVLAFAIDHNKYINIGNVVKYLGNDLALKLSHNHAITCCDTTYFILYVGKKEVLKKSMKQDQKVSLLNGFRATSTVDYQVSQNVSKFIGTICYAGLKTEN